MCITLNYKLNYLTDEQKQCVCAHTHTHSLRTTRACHHWVSPGKYKYLIAKQLHTGTIFQECQSEDQATYGPCYGHES